MFKFYFDYHTKIFPGKVASNETFFFYKWSFPGRKSHRSITITGESIRRIEEKRKKEKKEEGQNEKRNPLFEKKQPFRRAIARVTARVTDCKTME